MVPAAATRAEPLSSHITYHACSTHPYICTSMFENPSAPQHCFTPHTSTSLSQPQPHAAHLSYSLMLNLTPLPHPLDLCLHHCSISRLYLTFRRLPDCPQLSHSLNIYLTPYTSIPLPTPTPHSAHLHLTLLDTSPSALNPQLPASPTSTSHPRLTSRLAVALPLAARRR